MIVFLKSVFVQAKVVVFGQKWVYSGKRGCIRAKVVVLGMCDCIKKKVVVFGQIDCIRAQELYSGKVIVFG